jgi:hypothetical protein
MNTRLNEFTAGKAETIGFKALRLVSKYSKIPLVFHAGYSLVPYKNRWGKHLGILAYGSANKHWYRLNFSLSKTDEVESFDIWTPGKNPYDITPTYTMDISGMGISRAIYAVVDFIQNPAAMYALFQGMKEQTEEPFQAASLREAKIDAYAPVAEQFLQSQPSWIGKLVDGSGGYLGGTAEGTSFLQAMRAQTGLPKSILINVLAANSICMKAIKLNPGIAQAVGVTVSAAKSAANAVPIPTVASLSPGPSLTMKDIFASFPEGQQYAAQMKDASRPDGPLGIIYDYKKTLLGMYNVTDEGKNMLIASGRGGTGKTYTTEEVLQEQGLSEGVHFKTIKGAASMRAPTLQRLMAQAADMPFIIIDDADSVMSSPQMANCLKTALENNPGGRKMRIMYVNPKGHKGEDDEFIEKIIPIAFKIVWITNDDPESRWRANKWDDGDIVAVLRRAKEIKFNFTNEEVMDMIKQRLDSVMPDNEYITADRKFNLWKAMFTIVEQRALRKGMSTLDLWKGISFGDYRDLLGEWYTILVMDGNDRDFFEGPFKKQFSADIG